jgi:dCTP deaminase
MILTDREIQVFLDNKQISINPIPNTDCYSSTSVDLTLAKQFREWDLNQVDRTEGEVIEPADPDFKYDEFRDKYTKGKRLSDKGYVLGPKKFILAWTHEKIKIPNHSRIAARVEGKSLLARLGVAIHVTAPTIHAGFEGPIQLELCNHGLFSIRLIPGMPICQLIFEMTLGTPEKGYSGQFLRQER